MEYIIKNAGDTLTSLKNVWDVIGCSTDYRREQLNELAHDVISVYEGYLTKEERYKENLHQELTNCEDEIRSLRDELSEPAQGAQIGVGTPLLGRLSHIKEEMATLQQTQKQRKDELSEMVQDIKHICREIGTKVELGECGLSCEELEKVRKIWKDIKNEKITRQTEVRNLQGSLNELLAELGEDEGVHIKEGIKIKDENSGDQFGPLTPSAVSALRLRQDHLTQVRTKRQIRLEELAQKITPLWDLLEVPLSEREEFVAKRTGFLTKNVIDACEKEYARLISIRDKQINMQVEQARARLQSLWDELHTPAEERVVAKSDASSFCENENNVESAVEELKNITNQISVLESHLAAIKPILTLIEKWETLQKEKADLETVASDPGRLLSKKAKRDPGWLLREEKARKKLTIKLPKVESKLRKSLITWQNVHDGVPFLYNGVAYLDVMLEHEEVEKKVKDNEKLKKEKDKAQQLENEILFGSTPKKSFCTPLKGMATPTTPQTKGRAVGIENSSFSVANISVINSSSTKRKRAALSPICNSPTQIPQSPRVLPIKYGFPS